MKQAVLLFVLLILGVWQGTAQSVILTSDQQLEGLTNPDTQMDLSLGYNKYIRSLREICEEGKKQGSSELIIAFDEFFRQYRNDTGAERKLTPDMGEYVSKIKIISDFAQKYDLGLCLSLLSPLSWGRLIKSRPGTAEDGWPTKLATAILKPENLIFQSGSNFTGPTTKVNRRCC